MLVRALVVWVGLVVLAIGNGALRQGILVQRLGAARAQVASTVMLCLLILAVAAAAVRWIGPRSTRDTFVVGTLWVVLTLAFELVFGHFVAGDSWSELAAAYDVTAGRVWVLVPLTVLLAPYLAARARGVLS